MWKLEKPLLDDAIRDIKKIIAESGGVISSAEGNTLSYIYRLYDRGQGYIHPSDNDRCSTEVQDTLYNMYKQKTYEGQKLYYIRKELFKLADICPMCGIGEPSQLDHQLPRSIYKSLSLCRLNLVPVCSMCNNKKKDKDSTRFIHPYYQEFPNGKMFLVANIHINEKKHVVSWKYEFDVHGIDDKLREKIHYQASVIKLLRRIQKASNSFVSEMFYCSTFQSPKALKRFLQNEFNKKTHLYGLNDWRTVLLHALFTSPKFGVEEAIYLAGKCKPFNRGANA